MKLAIIGMGYVGCVSAVCLAKEGHMVVGVDSNSEKVSLINQGISPILEPEIPELLSDMVSLGRLKATIDVDEAIGDTELCFVCVGTPSKANGDLELCHIERVSEDIGFSIRKTKKPYTVVVRSTILPGTTESIIIPILEMKSGKKAFRDFSVYFNPEFLREGSSFFDFYHPPKTVVGGLSQTDGDILETLFDFLQGPFFRTTLKVAEMIKYTDNAFHALKIGFANEIGRICKELDIDSWEIMDVFCADNKLNISSAYFKPGFAFGGSCLPKDLRALNYKARMKDLELPILSSILTSNQIQIDSVFKRILCLGKNKVGFLGLSFKKGTDDLRESPIVTLIEHLLGKGIEITIYDKNVNLSNLIGANREHLEKHIPHIAALMRKSVEEVITNSEIIVIGHKLDEFSELIRKIDQEVIVLDMVRALENEIPNNIRYEGISW